MLDTRHMPCSAHYAASYATFDTCYAAWLPLSYAACLIRYADVARVTGVIDADYCYAALIGDDDDAAGLMITPLMPRYVTLADVTFTQKKSATMMMADRCCICGDR